MKPVAADVAVRAGITALMLKAGWMRFLAALCALGLLGVPLFGAPDHWHRANEQLSSFTWLLASEGVREQRLVVVDIDEKSVQELGAWPWPRERVAALLAALDARGVALRVVDILFDGAREGDDLLRRTLSVGSPAVVAQLFSLQTDPPLRVGAPGYALPEREGTLACAAGITPAWGYLAPAAGLAQSAIGHITPVVDRDGTVRKVPALVCFEGKAYPALAVAALAAATGETPQWTPSPAFAGEGVLRVGDFLLPTSRRGELRVSYAIPRGSFVAVSAADVLAGRLPQDMLRGVWALVGSTALGAGDAVVTPQGGAVGGIEVHAQLLAAALDARTPRDPGWSGWAIAGVCLFVLLFTLLALVPARPGPAVSLPLVALLNLSWMFAAHAYLLLEHHWVLHWGTPALFTVLCAGLLLLAEMVRVRLERERLFGNLSSYLPEAVARKLAFAEPSAQVQAERREATVMVLDLRNFSAFCEGRSPEESAQVLHRFYAAVEAAVAARGGVVEHLVGDGILAAWNASKPCENHVAQALGAALPVWREVIRGLPQEASRQAPPLDLGIGIETGPVLVGSFGAAQRRVHTVLGETVTVAVRLEALTGELAFPILLGPEVVAHAAAEAAEHVPAVKPLGNFLLAGLSRSRRVHALQVPLDQHRLHLVYRIDQDRALAS